MIERSAKNLTRHALRTAFKFYPFYSGIGTVANLKLPTWASQDLDDRAVTRLRSGAELVVNPHEFLGRSVYYSGEWDTKITWVIERILRKGDMFIDIGAHCGVTAIAAAAKIGPSGAVHAFEPQPDLAKMLAESADRNGFHHVHVHNVALSDKAGTFDLYLPTGKQIYGTLEPGNGADGVPHVSVRVEQASEFLSGLKLGCVRLIKIDIEGHEEAVFRGAAAFLDQTPTDAILFESVAAEGPFWQRKAVLRLSAMGYRFIGIPKRLFVMTTEIVRDGVDPNPDSHDFIAARSDNFEEIAQRLNAH